MYVNRCEEATGVDNETEATIIASGVVHVSNSIRNHALKYQRAQY